MPTRQILIAHDAEDLEVIAARLQDAIATIGEVKYLPKGGRFVATLSRFMWEKADGNSHRGGRGRFFRVRCGLTVNTVRAVQARNVDPGADDAFLSLLTIEHRKLPDGEEVLLVFAGDATIRLTVEALDVELSDLGRPWRTKRLPDHERPAAAAGSRSDGQPAAEDR